MRTGPVVRAKLLHLGAGEHVFYRNAHHIALDAWSQALVNRELFDLYSAMREGRSDALPAPAMQYSEFSELERQAASERAFTQSIEFWRHHLAGAPPLLQLHSERPRRRVQSFDAGLVCTTIDAERVSELKQLSRRYTCSLYVVLLALFGVLVNRHSGARDFVIGTPFANRTNSRLEETVGPVSQVLPMRIRLDAAANGESLLRQLRSTWLQSLRHSGVPLMSLLEALNVPWAEGYAPLFQVAFAMQNVPRAPDRLDGLETDQVLSGLFRIRYDLEVHLVESDSEIVIYWLYSRDLFDEVRIARLARDYGALLALRSPVQWF